MRTRLLPALVAGLLTLPLLGVAAADAAPRELATPRTPAAAPAASPGERAEAALARAEALRDADPRAARRDLARGGREATLVLRELMAVRDDLSAADRRRADALLARPTQGGANDGLLEYTVPEATPLCGTVICVHYVTSTPDAPVLTDADTSGVPDSVEQALATAEEVHDTYVAAGYRRPDPDGSLGGGSDLVDVYLGNLGDNGLYGYCTSDQQGQTWNRWAYCAIDDDFAEFGTNTPLENQQVTLAHEYFHAIQFAYDAFEDGWFAEATATWAEDELYDGVDDNHQYLPAGQLGDPYTPLDTWDPDTGSHYGNWVFFRYLTERWPAETGTLPDLVLELIERTSGRVGDDDDYSTQAIQKALAARGTSFTKVYGDFAVASRHPGDVYEEGASYPVSPTAGTFGLTARRPKSGTYLARPAHLSHVVARFVPGRGTRDAAWRVRIGVDLPASRTAPTARVIVTRRDGAVSTSTIRVSSTGVGKAVAGFSSATVAHVEIVLVNASRRMDCWRGTALACQGRALDNRVETRFSAVAFRK